MRDMTQEQVAWLAGFLEGEGCFYMSLKEPRVIYISVGLHARDAEILFEIKEMTGIGNISKTFTTKTGESKYWRVTKHKDIYDLIKRIYPWMFSRRKEKINQLLDYLELKIK